MINHHHGHLHIMQMSVILLLRKSEEKTDAMGTAELAFGITLVLEENKKRYTV